MNKVLSSEEQEVLSTVEEYEGGGTPLSLPGITSGTVAVYLGRVSDLDDDDQPIPLVEEVEKLMSSLEDKGFLVKIQSSDSTLEERWATIQHAKRLGL